MNTMRICKLCRAPLPADAPEGICPTCLMKAGLGTQSGAPNPAAGKAPPSVMELAPHFPNLEIIELIGQGGMGAVYKARQSQLDRFVALKILPVEAGNDPAFAERFAREARALARLNHPNIVSVYDFGRGGDFFYFVMEYVDGVNLRQMEQTQRLTPAQALKIVPLVCDALQYAHDEGVVHRDIKPGNILIDKKGRVKIADFGLAKLLGKATPDFALTQSNLVMGTPHYMAPEQMEKPLEVDHRADIYSLGVVFYEMLTGDLPIGRFSPPSAKVQVDVRLDEVVLKALENEPQRRYQQASEVKTDVESIVGQVEKLPPSMRRAFGFDYQSETKWFGVPLLHICSGTDPATGRARTARGIIAVGEKAVGVLALGGAATGVVAFGGLATGVVAIGGTAIGLLSFGGIALALLFATGGIALAPYAFGGIALGYVALGGVVFGAHAAGGGHDDPLAHQFYQQYPLWRVWTWAFAFSLASWPIQLTLQKWGRQKTAPGGRTPSPLATGVLVAVPILAAVLAATLLPRLFVQAEQRSSQPPAPAPVSEPATGSTNSEAMALVRMVQSRYESLSSLCATGHVVTEMSMPSGGTNQSYTLRTEFDLKLARPNYYRIEWTQPGQSLFTNRGAVWNAGKGDWVQVTGQPSEVLNREYALAMGTGASAGAAHWAPALFFKEENLQWLPNLANLALLPDEHLGGVDCRVLEGDLLSGHTVLWITKDGLVKQIRNSIDVGRAMSTASQSAAEVSDTSLRNILKTMGQEATPEAIARMRESYQKAGAKLATGQSTIITQTFEKQTVNELLSKEDFAGTTH